MIVPLALGVNVGDVERNRRLVRVAERLRIIQVVLKDEAVVHALVDVAENPPRNVEQRPVEIVDRCDVPRDGGEDKMGLGKDCISIRSLLKRASR
jgi:hypothetical protein